METVQFKDGRPGLVWMKNFMKRNRLSHNKKAEMISCARKSNTSNPFIIYDFYDLLEKVRANKQSPSPTPPPIDFGTLIWVF